MTFTPSLLSLCEFIVDCEHKTAPLATEGYPSIRTPNVGRGRLILQDVNRVDAQTYDLWTRRARPQSGDLIIAREAPVGNVAIIPENLQVCLGQRTVLVRPDQSKVASTYLCYYLLGEYAQSRFKATSQGATVAHLNMKDIRGLPMLGLHPRDEQERIAEILGAYDDLIEVNRRRVALLEEMARGLFEEWFVRFRFPGHEKAITGAGVPRPEWELRELGSFLSLAYGKALRSDDRRPGACPVIGSSGIVGSHTTALVDRRGIILGRKGNVGAVIWSASAFWPIDTVYYVESERPDHYLLELLRRVPFQNTDAAVPGLNRDAALKKVVLDPPLDLQLRYQRFCEAPRTTVDQLTKTNERLAAARDLLLPRLISGQLSVAEAELELAQAA